MAKAVDRLERRIQYLREIKLDEIQDFWSEAKAVESRVNSTLGEIFGLNTVEYDRAHASAHLLLASSSFSLVGGNSGPSRGEEIQAFRAGIEQIVKMLQTEKIILQERLDDGSMSEVEQVSAPIAQKYSDDEVFVVHGRAEAPKQEVARFLEQCGLQPRILHELDNRGNTIIEKFERHTASIGFAVVLLTPDDVGGPNAQNLQPRARQNVVAELFYFMGKLGRPRVVALKKGELEIPSDIAGVVYIDMDDRGAWKQDLVKELRAAGYSGDWAKALFG
jgi:predicted nucleotide-binding protein